MLTIHQAIGDEHRETVRGLFTEYLHAVCPVRNRQYGVGFDAEAILEHDMTELGVFRPPGGHLLLAYEREGAAEDVVVEEMRTAGCARLRLDSARFMADAHSLDRAARFREIEPYPESEVPAAFHAHWVFMELPLGEDRGSVP